MSGYPKRNQDNDTWVLYVGMVLIHVSSIFTKQIDILNLNEGQTTLLKLK